MRRVRLMSMICGGLALLLLSGCVYTNIQRPYDRNYDKTELGTKVGKSSFKTVFWCASWGDAGTKAAAENGDITVIRHADAEYFMVLLGLYSRITTVVYGE